MGQMVVYKRLKTMENSVKPLPQKVFSRGRLRRVFVRRQFPTVVNGVVI